MITSRQQSIAQCIYQQSQIVNPLTAIVFMNIDYELITFREDPKNNGFTQALQQYGQDVTEVVIKNVPDLLSPLTFSKLKKCLPKLKKITLWDTIDPKQCPIIPDLKQCLLKGIKLVLPDALETQIRRELIEFLKTNNQSVYAQEVMRPGFRFSDLSDNSFDAFVRAYQAATEYSEANNRDVNEFSEMYSHYNINCHAQLLKDYESGEGFDTTSPWFENRPKKLSDFDFTNNPQSMMALYAIATKLKLWPLLAQGFGTRSSVLFANHNQLAKAFHDPAVLALGNTPAQLLQCVKTLIAIAAKGSFAAYKEAATTAPTLSR